MKTNKSEILIIGAGMAGLSCARALAEAGIDVCVLDKGRGPGGRMAARRAEVAGETVSFDHGAQYFTARTLGFQKLVKAWEGQGVVSRWPAAGEEAWVGTPGMNGPIRAMGLETDVRWGTRALAVKRDADAWFVDAGDESFTAKTVLVAVPAEQAAELLQDISPELARVPASVQSEPCWAVMAAFGERLPIAEDGLRDSEAAISWAARNSAKPQRAGEECWVLHASPARSREIIDLPKEEAAQVLLADFFAQTRIDEIEPEHLVAHRWLYAMPVAVAGEPARYDADLRIGIAGDYLHSPRVEGAFVSGQALAARVLRSRS
ncbi:transmembrane protein [Erythrobacter longus]|uniref:Transmembrane protein n=1 Tax=Erythrobacter longus TaxID=1044 RepID=A0A074MGC3_ERYLO|nr:FAD-dependent oxidoreductase [Erythrobacter longus]KEO91870.1 transmembrane protein [Erythrobacter longus]